MDSKKEAVKNMLEACDINDLDAAKTIQKQFMLDDDDFDVMGVVIRACGGGHLEMAQWLTETFDVTWSDITCDDNMALIAACNGKHFEVVTWLVDTFYNCPKSQQEAIRDMLEACENNDLCLAKSLQKQFMINADDLGRCAASYTAVMACCNGHLEMAQWLTETFDLTREDIQREDNIVLIDTCKGKHFEVIRWLIDTFYDKTHLDTHLGMHQ